MKWMKLKDIHQISEKLHYNITEDNVEVFYEMNLQLSQKSILWSAKLVDFSNSTLHFVPCSYVYSYAFKSSQTIQSDE